MPLDWTQGTTTGFRFRTIRHPRNGRVWRRLLRRWRATLDGLTARLVTVDPDVVMEHTIVTTHDRLSAACLAGLMDMPMRCSLPTLRIMAPRLPDPLARRLIVERLLEEV